MGASVSHCCLNRVFSQQKLRGLPWKHHERGKNECTDQRTETQSHKSIYRFEEQLLLFLPSVLFAKRYAKK